MKRIALTLVLLLLAAAVWAQTESAQPVPPPPADCVVIEYLRVPVEWFSLQRGPDTGRAFRAFLVRVSNTSAVPAPMFNEQGNWQSQESIFFPARWLLVFPSQDGRVIRPGERRPEPLGVPRIEDFRPVLTQGISDGNAFAQQLGFRPHIFVYQEGRNWGFALQLTPIALLWPQASIWGYMLFDCAASAPEACRPFWNPLWNNPDAPAPWAPFYLERPELPDLINQNTWDLSLKTEPVETAPAQTAPAGDWFPHGSPLIQAPLPPHQSDSPGPLLIP